MGKVYKDKKHSCAMCKPHKRKWAPKKDVKTRAKEKAMDLEIKAITVNRGRYGGGGGFKGLM